MVTTLAVSLIQAKVFSEKVTTVTLISTGASKKKQSSSFKFTSNLAHQCHKHKDKEERFLYARI